MRINHWLLLTLISLLAGTTACNDLDLNVDVPKCIERKIKKANPQQVWLWKSDATSYYYFVADCCDRYNELFDSDCNYICAPDGGLTGAGDKKCPEFPEPVEKTLIWEKK